MKILITGIYGFLGFRLAEKLAEKHSVSGLYHSNRKTFTTAIEVYGNADDITFSPDAIVFCHAAVSSGNYSVAKDILMEANVGFTKKILEKFPNSKAIYISSVSVFGNPEAVINENSETNPLTDYAISKLLGENAVTQNGGTIIRISSLYGEGMKENTLIPNYTNQALQNKSIQVWGNGARMQNYIHVNDAVSLIEKVLESEVKPDFPLLGVSDSKHSNDEVAQIISQITGSRIEYVKEDSSPSSRYDNKLTQKVLNWKPETALPEGIKHYLEWKEKQS